MGYNHRNVYFSATPIAIEQALQIAPTIGAVAAHESRSSRYAYVPTLEVLRSLMKHTGYQIHGVTTAAVRDQRKAGFEKHLIRLRHPNAKGLDGRALELLLLNSHDGSTCYEVMNGIFEFACANGLICGDSYTSAKIKHTGDVVKDVVDATYEVVQDAARITESIDRMQQITLCRDEKMVMAEAAMEVRFPSDNGKERPFPADRLLTVRRAADANDSLWSTFNVLQENCTKGGITGRIMGANGRRRRTTTKDVNGIDQNVRVNRILHRMAEHMAELKEAA